MMTKCIIIRADTTRELSENINRWLEEGHDFKRSSFQMCQNNGDMNYCVIFFYDGGAKQ